MSGRNRCYSSTMTPTRIANGSPIPTLLRLAANATPSECVEHWQKGRYGKLSGNIRMHTFVCTTYHGEKPEWAEHTRHLCGNARCVNPHHLAWGTVRQNGADTIGMGRTTRGDKNARAKLTRADVLAIRADPRLQRIIAADYGIDQTHVSAIKLRKFWGWLADEETQGHSDTSCSSESASTAEPEGTNLNSSDADGE